MRTGVLAIGFIVAKLFFLRTAFFIYAMKMTAIKFKMNNLNEGEKELIGRLIDAGRITGVGKFATRIWRL